MIQSYRDLEVWKSALGLAVSTYDATRQLPVEERFGLVLQMRRAAASIAANIAEGHGRFGRREYLHHLSIASGSLRELETLVEVATGTGLLAEPTATALLARTDRVGRMLTRLRQRLSGH